MGNKDIINPPSDDIFDAKWLHWIMHSIEILYRFSLMTFAMHCGLGSRKIWSCFSTSLCGKSDGFVSVLLDNVQSMTAGSLVTSIKLHSHSDI